jgi:hypothetical protein
MLGHGFRDWQKPDLSIDVIYQAAPKVQHLVLYWSGNQAILRGWASEEGIPRLCCPANKSELKTVTIYAAPVGYPGSFHQMIN